MWRRVRRRPRHVWIPVSLQVWPLAQLWYRSRGLIPNGHPEKVVWYFAYGANMHGSAFRVRRGMRPDEWRAGRTTGYRLRFDLEGRPMGRAAPTRLNGK